MLVIREQNVGQTVGAKVAGGVRTMEEATQYLTLAQRLFGKAWIDGRHFRFGVSSLLANVLKVLDDENLNAKNNR